MVIHKGKTAEIHSLISLWFQQMLQKEELRETQFNNYVTVSSNTKELRSVFWSSIYPSTV